MENMIYYKGIEATIQKDSETEQWTIVRTEWFQRDGKWHQSNSVFSGDSQEVCIEAFHAYVDERKWAKVYKTTEGGFSLSIRPQPP